jgi:hypothetical protein
LRGFYEAKLRFVDIFTQNDSAEALLQLMEGYTSGELASI